MEIEDAPRFRYRGLLLDVARWFYPPEFIEKVIDLLALYKLNILHLHLTDDQGWRLEIKKYPRLTQVGAWRKETIVGQNFDPYVGDGTPHGGFYTQEQMRDLVAYAAARHVTIMPEIEMPGHARAALAAYPELSCTGETFEVSTRWGVHEDIFCPSEQTFAFLQDVLLEVMQLFPSKYIHIGGDEVPKKQWEDSPVAQEVIRREGLGNEEGLQSYFIRRIEGFLRAHGRRLIGWDETLEGGLAPEATVMSWRGVEGGIEAARQGHDVIMTPANRTYFDYYQGDPGGRAAGYRRLRPARQRVRVRAGAGRPDARAGRPRHRRPGKPVDRVHPDAGAGGVHDAAPHAGARGGPLVHEERPEAGTGSSRGSRRSSRGWMRWGWSTACRSRSGSAGTGSCSRTGSASRSPRRFPAAMSTTRSTARSLRSLPAGTPALSTSASPPLP